MWLFWSTCLSSLLFSFHCLSNEDQINGENLLKQLAEKHQLMPLDEKAFQSQVSSFKNLNRVQQLQELKQKMMQALGGVNTVYDELGLNSLTVKSKIMTILRQIQSTTEELADSVPIFKQVSNELDDLLRFIPEDAVSQRLAGPPSPPSTDGKDNDYPQSEWRPVKAPYPGWGQYPRPEWGQYPKPEWKPPKAENWRPPQGEWVQPDWGKPQFDWGPNDNYPYPQGGNWGSGFNILKVALHPILDVINVVRNLVNFLI